MSKMETVTRKARVKGYLWNEGRNCLLEERAKEMVSITDIPLQASQQDLGKGSCPSWVGAVVIIPD